MCIQRQRAILLEVCKLQLNVGPTYRQTLFQRVAHSYDMRTNGKLLQPKCYNQHMAQNRSDMKGQKYRMKYVTF